MTHAVRDWRSNRRNLSPHARCDDSSNRGYHCTLDSSVSIANPTNVGDFRYGLMALGEPHVQLSFDVSCWTLSRIMTSFIAYYRVSTERQGKSGLGLAAQKRRIDQFLAPADQLIGEFCDIQSGRRDTRVELQKALALAKRESAKLIIARLDRFSRRVSFIANVMEQGISLCCAEMPHASDFQLHIFAALAQEERRLISERTKAALAEAKRRGKILGTNGKSLSVKNRMDADNFAASLRANFEAEFKGLSYSEIARRLNKRGIVTRTGRKFFPQTVKNYLSR